ncbi:cobalt-zinc-cadmium resistance protein CzcC precursor [mine drainage metagenome]|uniref:Cobalt-zinc-cadmium resistance protein CzcC n=1 Tax=mine drainage metagenome TaxID=410659 RepID=A0A1J5QZP7_9ZZZZ
MFRTMAMTLLLTPLLGLLPACAMQTYEARPIAPEQSAARFGQRSLDDTELHNYMVAQGYPENGFPIKTWGMEELTLAAFFFHPQLEVARAGWQLARTAETTAARKPDPELSTIGEHHSIPGTIPGGAVSPWTLGFSLGIPIETAGKRAIRMEHAASLSEAARIEIGQAAWQIRSRLRGRLSDYHGALQQISLLERELAIRREIVQLLQNRLDAGMVSDIDLTNSRLQAQKTQQALAAEQGRLPGLRAALAEAIGLPAQALASVSLSTKCALPASLPDDQLQRAALTNRLDVRAALARYAASESKLKLEIAKQYPDITLWPGYAYDQGDNRWSLGLSMILPLLDRNRGPIAEANAQRELEARQFYALQTRVIGELDQARTGYQAALDEMAEAGQTLAAQQRRAMQTERQFEAGYADRLDEVGTRLETLTSEQAVLVAQTRMQRILGTLEDAMQRPLDDRPLPTVPETPHEP